MTKVEEPKVHDLRDDQPAVTPDPKIAKKQPGALHELVQVAEPHLVTPGIGTVPDGQTTHE